VAANPSSKGYLERLPSRILQVNCCVCVLFVSLLFCLLLVS